MTDFLAKLKNYALGFFSIVAAIFVALFFIEKKKEQDQAAINTNDKVINKVDQVNTQINDLEKQTKEEENAPQSKEDLLDFLNSKK